MRVGGILNFYFLNILWYKTLFVCTHCNWILLKNTLKMSEDMYNSSSNYFYPVVNFWEYSYISSSPFLPKRNLNPIPHSTSKFWPLLSLIAVVYICVYVYPCIILNITCSVHIILHVCLFSELTIWHWTNNWCPLPCGGTPVLSPAFLVCL